MLIAKYKKEDKNVVSYKERDFILKNRKDFICPHCKDKVIYADAIFKIKHFRHKAKRVCESEPETETHIQMKKFICEFLNENPKQVLEKNLGFSIPDLYIKDKRIAIECQASQISIRKFIERSINYHKNGVFVLWIWDYDLVRRKKCQRLFNKILRRMYHNRIYFYDNENIFSLQFTTPNKFVDLPNNFMFSTFGSLPDFLEDHFDLSDLQKEEIIIERGYNHYPLEYYKIRIARFSDKYQKW